MTNISALKFSFKDNSKLLQSTLVPVFCKFWLHVRKEYQKDNTPFNINNFKKTILTKPYDDEKGIEFLIEQTNASLLDSKKFGKNYEVRDNHFEKKQMETVLDEITRCHILIMLHTKIETEHSKHLSEIIQYPGEEEEVKTNYDQFCLLFLELIRQLLYREPELILLTNGGVVIQHRVSEVFSLALQEHLSRNNRVVMSMPFKFETISNTNHVVADDEKDTHVSDKEEQFNDYERNDEQKQISEVLTKEDLATIEQSLSKVVLNLEAKEPDHTVVVMPGLFESLNQIIQLQHVVVDLLKSINHNTHLPPSYSTSLENVSQTVPDVIVSVSQQPAVNSVSQKHSSHSLAQNVPVMIRSNNIPILPINDEIDGDSEIVEEVHDDNDDEDVDIDGDD